MDSLDFDLNNYTDEELYQLIELPQEASKEEINQKTDTLIAKYINMGAPLYSNFFNEVQQRLLSLLEEDEEPANMDSFIKTEYEPNDIVDQNLVNRRSFTKIVNNDHAILRRERLEIGQGTGIPFVQGQMNPTLRNIKRQLINIDSQHRKLIQCTNTGSSDCSGTPCSSTDIQFADSATDFTFNLSQPVNHVLKLALYSYEIPHAWYVFSEDYGTTSFGISGECVDISAGNYDPSGLVQAIAAVLPSGTSITYNTINQKVTFDGGGSPFSLIFYDISDNLCPPTSCGLQGPRLDYNLGWLLGFRQPSYSGSSSYTGEGLIDTYGPRYILLELNDFNSNRLNQSVISLDANLAKFSYPASTRCNLPAAQDPSSNSSCGKGPPTWRGESLTAVQTYVRAQILNAQQEAPPHRYRSPVNSDIIARIPVRKIGHYGLLYDNWSEQLNDTAREYFGPVTLKRFRVRLLNDKGYVINLNNMNFSFSLIAEHLYQY